MNIEEHVETIAEVIELAHSKWQVAKYQLELVEENGIDSMKKLRKLCKNAVDWKNRFKSLTPLWEEFDGPCDERFAHEPRCMETAINVSEYIRNTYEEELVKLRNSTRYYPGNRNC